MSSTVSTAAVVSVCNLSETELITFLSYVKEKEAELKSLKNPNDVFSDGIEISKDEIKEMVQREADLKGWQTKRQQLEANNFSNLCSTKNCNQFVDLPRLELGLSTCRQHSNTRI